MTSAAATWVERPQRFRHGFAGLPGKRSDPMLVTIVKLNGRDEMPVAATPPF